MAQEATFSEQRAAAAGYLAFTYPGDADSIRAIMDAAWADAKAGKTVVSTSYEGASTSSILTGLDPTAILAACQDVLSSMGVAGATSTASRSIFTRFGSQVAQT